VLPVPWRNPNNVKILQGDLAVTTEDENEESKRQQKSVQHTQRLCGHLTEESTG
jgi:hypothetical protein